MSIRTSDGKNFRRITRTTGDRVPAVGIKRPKAFYTAVGGETSLDLTTLSPQISYQPGTGQLEIKSSAGPMLEGLDYFETSGTTIGFPSPGLSSGEKLEIVKTLEYSGNLVADVRPDEYSEVAIVGQTVFNADFSWPYNQNPSKRHGAIKVYLNGILQQRGASFDYVETQLTGANTNQITFNTPLLGGENVSILRLYQAIDETAASTQFNNTRLTDLQGTMAKGFQGFVDEETDKIDVPFTTIVNRAKIPNLANDLKPRMGIERIIVQQIIEAQDEFGPNGGRVFKALNDDKGLIRFVGSDWTQQQSTSGFFCFTPSVNEYCEITFYGTGLNILSTRAGINRNSSVYLNGSLYGTFIQDTLASSNVLNVRNYASNIVNNVVQTTLGLHTVRIQCAVGGLSIYGFEVIGPTSVVVPTGTAYSSGRKLQLLTEANLPYKPATMTGTKGGRVVTYLDTDQEVKQAFTEVPASPSYLTSANHANEEVVRTYHWREFGAARNATSGTPDDFSITFVGGSNLAFTLDDGTTTLVGYSVLYNSTTGGISFQINGSLIQITFVGTGLDVLRQDAATGTDTQSVTVDGVPIGNLNTTGNTSPRLEKVVSGLPYGTHTVRITRVSAVNYNSTFLKFIVYGPKKPALPSGAVELADYNLMANYVAASGDATILGGISSGVLFKTPAREAVYVNTWTMPGIATSFASGMGVVSSAAIGNYFEYTFFGTGFNAYLACTASSTAKVKIDEVDYTGSAIVTNGGSWVPGTSTATIPVAGGAGCQFQITGLSLGVHKVRITTDNAQQLYFYGISIITPVYSPKSNLYADIQNTLPIGSNSISDSRKVSAIKEALPAQKAWAQAKGVSSSPTTNSLSAVPLPDMSVVITTKGNPIKISYQVNLLNSLANSYSNVSAYVNGANAVEFTTIYTTSAAQVLPTSKTFILPVSAGTHKIDLYWFVSAGTATANSQERILTVEEL